MPGTTSQVGPGIPPSLRSPEERQRICDELDDLLDDVDLRLARESRERNERKTG